MTITELLREDLISGLFTAAGLVALISTAAVVGWLDYRRRHRG